jgi:hypothetical protein
MLPITKQSSFSEKRVNYPVLKAMPVPAIEWSASSACPNTLQRSRLSRTKSEKKWNILIIKNALATTIVKVLPVPQDSHKHHHPLTPQFENVLNLS